MTPKCNLCGLFGDDPHCQDCDIADTKGRTQTTVTADNKKYVECPYCRCLIENDQAQCQRCGAPIIEVNLRQEHKAVILKFVYQNDKGGSTLTFAPAHETSCAYNMRLSSGCDLDIEITKQYLAPNKCLSVDID